MHPTLVAPALLLWSTMAAAQQALPPPTALMPDAPPHTIEPQPLPPPAPPPLPPPAPLPRPSQLPSPAPAAGSPPAAPASAEAAAQPATGRVFCDQNVSFHLMPADSVPERYRPFVGMFSDAAWTPALCAALIVERVEPDGTAAIIYVFGPMASNSPAKGGVLHGTGIIRDGTLRFQNSDGSQYAFRPLYSDLDGRLTTPKGESYGAIFKKTL